MAGGSIKALIKPKKELKALDRHLRGWKLYLPSTWPVGEFPNRWEIIDAAGARYRWYYWDPEYAHLQVSIEEPAWSVELPDDVRFFLIETAMEAFRDWSR